MNGGFIFIGMSDFTRRGVLTAIGGSAAIGGMSSVVAAEEESSGRYIRTGDGGNFGIFNNSDKSREVTVTIQNKGRELFRRTFALRGLNEKEIDNPKKAQSEGSIHIDTTANGRIPVTAQADNDKRAVGEVYVEEGGISEYATLSVYVRPDGSPEIKNTLR